MLMRQEIFLSARLTIAKSPTFRSLSVDQLRESLANNTSEVRKALNIFKRNITGSEHWWKNELTKLTQACMQAGMPAFFITLSCNDHYWSDIAKLYGSTTYGISQMMTHSYVFHTSCVSETFSYANSFRRYLKWKHITAALKFKAEALCIFMAYFG